MRSSAFSRSSLDHRATRRAYNPDRLPSENELNDGQNDDDEADEIDDIAHCRSFLDLWQNVAADIWFPRGTHHSARNVGIRSRTACHNG